MFAWDERAANQVLCAILHVETTTMAWSLGFRNLVIPGTVLPISGMPFDHARNSACQAALDRKVEWLFFLDSDVVPPRDAVLRLIQHQQPIISGMYCRRSPPVAVPVMMRNHQWITDYPPGHVIDVELVGAGCLLIHRSVLEQLKPLSPGHRWFDWRVDLAGTGIYPPGECLSEDYSFCLQARKQGWKVKVDTSIICRHVGLGEAGPNTFGPCNPTPNT